jgi:hypothetical protein
MIIAIVPFTFTDFDNWIFFSFVMGLKGDVTS